MKFTASVSFVPSERCVSFLVFSVSSKVFAGAPIEISFSELVSEFVPNATEFACLATVFLPKASAPSPPVCAIYPMATE